MKRWPLEEMKMNPKADSVEDKIDFDPETIGGFSTHALRRFLAGELSEKERGEIEKGKADNSELSAWFQDEAAKDAAFQISMPYSRFEADHEKRRAETLPLEKTSSWFSKVLEQWKIATPAMVALTAALVFWVGPKENLAQQGASTGTTTNLEAPSGQNRLKGGQALGMMVRSLEGARYGVEGESLQPGDQVQFLVREKSQYSAKVLLSIDGKGIVTTYLSQEGQIGKGAEKVALTEKSIILDDALGVERFFLVYGAGDVESLRVRTEDSARMLAESGADLRKVETLPLEGANIEQSSFFILKVR
jgi:hypothetical protein